MNKHRWFTRVGPAVLGLTLIALTAPAAQALTVTAYVVKQSCFNRDFVQVTLSAQAQPNQRVKFRWDFNNDGVFDTPLLTNPTVTHRYPDEKGITARVRAVNAKDQRATDRVSFRTKACGGGGTDG